MQQFYEEVKGFDRRLYEHIAVKQDPHTLFITCSDSRLVPSRITSADPGELFIIRNVGNFIPPYNSHSLHSEGVALEFALSNLAINDIVVCGHTNCGAVRACCVPGSFSPQLQQWIEMMRRQLKVTRPIEEIEVAKQNVLNQLENLKTYPVVQEMLRNRELHLHAWYFDFEKNMVHEWDATSGLFKPL